jgi:hypothetical protein
MPDLLSPEQQNRAIEAMREYLAAPPAANGRTPVQDDEELDKNRATLIESDLQPLVQSYLQSVTPLSDFKSKIDGINKRHTHWGFKGIKGQMFFNMVVNVANDLGECDQEIKASIALPANDEIARSRIKTFQSYIRRIGDESVEAGGSKMARPKPGSIPFFLSYFWQIQDRTVWPVYYTNAVNTMIDLNLWQPSDDIANDYVTFKHLQSAFASLFSAASGKPFGLYDVEHVFWFKGGNPYDESKPERAVDPSPHRRDYDGVVDPTELISRLPESYVPPVVSVLTRMARGEAGLAEAAHQSGTSLPKAFEKSIHAAFTILGYETKLLGQGMGRVPDGLAIDHDNSYAILWDGKIRESGYSMGTDDRAIREYVSTQSRELKRRRSVRNIYYVVVSSYFHDDFDDLIRGLKMETHTNEVCLLEAPALVAMVDAKMRNPLQVSLGPDGLQRLFSDSGILTAADVLELLS